MEIVEATLATILGFGVYVLFTHPKFFKKKVPTVSIGRMQLLPNLKINFKNQTIHLHHWFLLSTTLGFLNHITQGIDHLFFVKFFTIGGIIQGFAFRDRFKIFIQKTKIYRRLPSISVVVPAYNEAKSISKTLDSLKRQDYKGKFEIIVVDNGSTDNTADIAKKYGAVVIYEQQKGTGFARQAGFMAASGQIIATTDADSIVPYNWLTRFAQEFAKRPKTVMIAGMYDFYDGSPLLKISTWLFNYRLFAVFGWYSGANMAVKREAFLTSGGFDTAITLSEDSDLGVRLRKLGQVTRLANFKVKTSARRFNQLGFLGGLWDYSINYIKFKLHLGPHKVNFRSGSEVPKLSFWPKLAIHIIIAVAILAGLFGGVLEIKPVRAQIVRREKQLRHQISKIDVDLPHVSGFHYVRHK